MCMVNTQKQLEEAYLKNVYQKLIDKKTNCGNRWIRQK
ncbi:conserved hypothetical protein [Enterococcus faecium E4453]|nr:conserved hypothetical protein [Enterococcus faecium E4453]